MYTERALHARCCAYFHDGERTCFGLGRSTMVLTAWISAFFIRSVVQYMSWWQFTGPAKLDGTSQIIVSNIQHIDVKNTTLA
jgi:hypothetical protein